MEHFFFVPQSCPSRERVKSYDDLADENLRNAAFNLADVFLGKCRGLCKQVAWMGRGCFTRPEGAHYLVVKGAGPSPGSEHMRIMLDQLMRRRGGGSGGCLRLDTETFFPLLVQFVQRNGGWTVFDPRPEGFSMFSFLYREAEAGWLLSKLGVRAVLPLSLLRNKLHSPWPQRSRVSLQQYLSPRLSGAIPKHLKRKESQQPINFASLVYLDLDGGVLIRKALSPYRIANLHQTVVENDREGLEFLTSHMLQLDGAAASTLHSIQQLSARFTSDLAQTAAVLLSEGVIHGQLNVHHQNITLAAEIADFDELIFVRGRSHLLDGIPFPESRLESFYSEFEPKMRTAEKHFSTDITTVLSDDFREFVGLDYEGVNKPRLAAFMLRQIYDLYAQALITVDLLQRNLVSNLQQSGTVLTPQQICEVESTFAGTLVENLRSSESVALIQWCLANGLEYLFRRLLNRKQRRTFYGWTHERVAVSRLIDICDDVRAKHILREADSFFATLKTLLKSH